MAKSYDEESPETYFRRIVVTFWIALFVILLALYERTRKKKYKYPPGPWGLPILGYLPFLGREPYKELARLKEIYGNVFGLYMGSTYVVILDDFEAVKEAFSKSATTDRPERLFDFIPDAVGFSSVNGEEWVEQRKFCVKSMGKLGVGKGRWESLIQIEVEDFIKLVSSFHGQPVDISKILTSSVSNNISTFVFGKRLPYNHPDRRILDKAMEDIFLHMNQSSIHHFFPIFRDVSLVLGIGSIAEEHKRMVMFNNFFRKEVKKLTDTYKNGEEDNFIVDYMKEMDNQKQRVGHYFNETNLLGNIQALFLAGSDTSSASLNWLILAMAQYPDIQKKVQLEVDLAIGKDGAIQWSDRKKVPYTHATIMEGQRWKTIAPLNTARIATEDIQIQNYDIPKGTTIIANNWGLHNDQKFWKDPEKFNPERFLTGDGKQVIMKPDSYVPFSYGKRNCPGEIIAMMEILSYFTALMQKFTILVPENQKLILDGILGLTYHSYPQKLLFVPRH